MIGYCRHSNAKLITLLNSSDQISPLLQVIFVSEIWKIALYIGAVVRIASELTKKTCARNGAIKEFRELPSANFRLKKFSATVLRN